MENRQILVVAQGQDQAETLQEVDLEVEEVLTNPF